MVINARAQVENLPEVVCTGKTNTDIFMNETFLKGLLTFIIYLKIFSSLCLLYLQIKTFPLHK